jgi:hypothetical protein
MPRSTTEMTGISGQRRPAKPISGPSSACRGRVHYHCDPGSGAAGTASRPDESQVFRMRALSCRPLHQASGAGILKGGFGESRRVRGRPGATPPMAALMPAAEHGLVDGVVLGTSHPCTSTTLSAAACVFVAVRRYRHRAHDQVTLRRG